MKNRFLAAGLLVIGCFPSLAQVDSVKNTPARSVRYANNFLTGVLFADKGEGNTFSFSTSHGIRYKRLFGGIGVGYDTYSGWNAIPMFATVAFDFANIRRNAFYVSASGGYSAAWSAQPEEVVGNVTYEEEGRGNFSAMVGYRIQANRYRIYISGGYKFQRIQYESQGTWWWSAFPRNSTEVQMDLERVVIQIGIGIN